ncbi:SGNH/GDSL hydrolase family protein [Flavobacteriaceae bacterium M23B6Z8]
MKYKYTLLISLVLNLVLLAALAFKYTSEANTSNNEESTKIVKLKETDSITIVMLGNSITAAGSWKKVLQRDDVFNGGMPGWTTEQLSWVIKDFVIPNNPKLCFFKGGINDYTLGITTNRIFQNICSNLDSIKNVGTVPVYTTTLYQKNMDYRNRQIDSLNDRMLDFCKKRNYDFVDLRPYLCKDGDILSEYVQDDGTHLRPEAYPEWAKAIQPVIEKYGL